MVEVRQCRGCGFPVARIAARCPRCKKSSPGYSDRELKVRRWKMLLGVIAILVVATAVASFGSQ